MQIVGDHEFALRNAPKSYAWEISQDGHLWRPLAGAAQIDERRLYRLHRLPRAERGRFIRLNIQAAHGDFPVVREIEIWPDPQAPILFPDWVVAVNVTHDSRLPGEGQAFIPLAKSCAGGHSLQAQQIWLTDLCDTFLAAEPRPLCGFLSGSYRDWCEVNREHWRGVQEVLSDKRLPLWASCGGARFGARRGIRRGEILGLPALPRPRPSQDAPVHAHRTPLRAAGVREVRSLRIRARSHARPQARAMTRCSLDCLKSSR